MAASALNIAIAAVFACAIAAAMNAQTSAPADYDPTRAARAAVDRVENPEAGVPPMCYTMTEKRHNPCWTCHVVPLAPNDMLDWDLQKSYEFSPAGRKNRWTNLFVDRTAAVAAQTDAETLAYIREDNYTPLRAALGAKGDLRAFTPDLDIARGFDADGFAKDGSGWRAIRYRPFPGTFWPTNGSVDDVFIRLPAAFGTDADGRPSRADLLENYAILESAILGAEKLPAAYRGGAAAIAVRKRLYPEGVEFLHTVRYVDPDRADLIGTRMKEVRWSKKMRAPDDWALARAYARELEERTSGAIPTYSGTALTGVENDFGWRLTGYIEDAAGRLRLATDEEHLFCMGCHSHLGVTIDQTFTLARKIPGPDGWRYQDLRGQKDVPQAGQKEPEVLTYLERAGGGDELRANDEMIARFFAGGRVKRDLVTELGAREGGLLLLIAPSRERALSLAKAYRTIVREQSFVRGRDPTIKPVRTVHFEIGEDDHAFDDPSRIFRDGRLELLR